MWWIIIVGIVLFVIIKFLNDTKKQATSVAKQGGMSMKYRTLVEYLLSADPQSRILQQTASSITVGVSGMGGTTIFLIQQTYGDVTIQWQVNSPVFGKHRLEWTFNEFSDQNKMIAKIENDLSVYQSNMIQKYI